MPEWGEFGYGQTGSGGERTDPGARPGAGSSGAGEQAEAAWRALRDGLGAAAASNHGEMQCLELCPICRAADLLRASGPPELRDQIGEFQREALLTLRALLDHYIERLEAADAAEGGGGVEEIPIE